MDIGKINLTKEAIEEVRKIVSNKAEANAICSVLTLLHERIASMEQETNPGNAFIPFTPTATATPIR